MSYYVGAKNREACSRDYYKHKVKRLTRMRQYYKEHKEEIKANVKTYRANNPEKVLAIREKYKPRHAVNEHKRRLRKVYKLTVEQYNIMLLAQHGMCAICELDNAGRRLCVDHNHITGAIRGLLCNRCNRCLGLLKENKLTLKMALDYLEKYE